MQPERIAIAHDHLFQVGGAERVLAEFIRLYPRADVYSLIFKKKNFDFLRDTHVRTSRLQSFPGGVAFFKWFVGAMPYLWERFDFSDYELVLSSSSGFVKGLRQPAQALHISYCHSPTRYLWSDMDEYVASLGIPAPAKAALKHLLVRLREWDYSAAQRVDYFIANSRFIAERIRQYYHRESTVIYPPVSVRDFLISPKTDAYYLIVSRLRPYKRVDLAIEAFNNLRLPLIVIGGGEESRRLRARSRNNIKFLGEVSDETRNYYLSRCKAFIHPQEEDFGISAVEAMASGRPVIAYASGGALETVENGVSGTFFNEQSWESLAYAVLTFDHTSVDPHRIRSRAAQFDASVFRRRFTDFIAALTPGL